MKRNDSFEEALRLLAEQENEQLNTAPEHTFSDRHEQQMQTLLTRRVPRNNRLLTWGLSAAACLAVVGIALMSGLLHSPTPPAVPDSGSDGGAVGGMTSTTAALTGKTEIVGENMTGQTEIGTPDIWLEGPEDATAGNSSTPLYSYFCLHLKAATVTEVNDTYLTVVPEENTLQGNARKFCVLLQGDDTPYAVGDRVILELDPSKITQQTITETNEQNGTVTAYYVHVIEPIAIRKEG